MTAQTLRRLLASTKILPVVAILGIILVVAGAGLFGASWWAYGRRRHMADTPTSKVRSMAIGPVELNGEAVALDDKPLLAPFTGEPCVYWSYAIEEERTRVVTRTVNGKTTTHTERYWATVDSGKSDAPFGIRDETGTARLDPRGGDIPTPALTRFGSGFLRDPSPQLVAFLATRKLSHENILGFNRTMRYTQRALLPGTQLYVLANVERRADAPPKASGHEALVVQKAGAGPFMVSDKSEKQLTLRWTAAFLGLLALGIVLVAVGVAMLRGGL